MEVKYGWKSVMKTFDYHSFTVEANYSFSIERDRDMMEAFAAMRGLPSCVDEETGQIDPVRFDRICQQFCADRFQKNKSRVDKFDKSDFGLPQFEGENWS